MQKSFLKKIKLVKSYLRFRHLHVYVRSATPINVNHDVNETCPLPLAAFSAHFFSQTASTYHVVIICAQDDLHTRSLRVVMTYSFETLLNYVRRATPINVSHDVNETCPLPLGAFSAQFF